MKLNKFISHNQYIFQNQEDTIMFIKYSFIASLLAKDNIRAT